MTIARTEKKKKKLLNFLFAYKNVQRRICWNETAYKFISKLPLKNVIRFCGKKAIAI